MENKKKPWVKPELKPLDGNIQGGVIKDTYENYSKSAPTTS